MATVQSKEKNKLFILGRLSKNCTSSVDAKKPICSLTMQAFIGTIPDHPPSSFFWTYQGNLIRGRFLPIHGPNCFLE
ncbi:Hypothetical protein Minf_1270 [Methylacidiphilum infernorum V4]|uniref:Uncharacterized protein n=1 Tax=Methylacidiphilum infernorum (isolate V4) TaxID=481448 RepID=B3DVH1_METI4|nr:Hypothetical protein Minf_1270 [Methylacidiphilum infernorum V4]